MLPSPPFKEIRKALRILTTWEMKHYLLSTIGVLLCTLTALTQAEHQATLKSGVILPETFSLARDFGEQAHEQARSGDYAVLLLQFETLPTSYQQRAAILSAGVLLDAYIPENTYLARVPQGVDLELLNVQSFAPYLPEYKLSAALTYAPTAESENGVLTVRVYPYPSESAEALYQSLLDEGYPEVQLAGPAVQLSVNLFGISALSVHPYIMYMESAPSTPVPESEPGRSQHRANILSIAPGLGFDGTGVAIAIADDGHVSHEDFRGRITQYTTANNGPHGDMVAGIACGAGNIDPQAIGAAPGAMLHLYAIDGYPHVEQAPLHYTNHGTVVTITSYSESSAGEYSYSAYSLDGQAIEHPQLIHVFSAGNNAADAAHPLYGNLLGPDGARHGNITGGRKASKSAIAVGNVYENDDIRFSSSRGPAGDGRIKPDICAFGQGHLSTNTNDTYQFGGGTSAAAPGVGGGMAILVQLYRSLHNGNTPDGGLLKAALLNSAEDLGRTGPDYTYGWGRMHLGRAAATLQNFRHLAGTVAHGGQQNHTITIPPNTKQVRVMTYWTDVPGALMAGKALVNDLDSRLISPGNQTFMPWALSAFPHADSLLKPAWRGTDRLNNMEQVVLDNPVAGNYTLRVNGHLVPQGPQQYHVVYCFITKDIELTYPIGGEGFVPGESQIIRWDATNAGQTGSFSFSYSLDSMASWTPVTITIPAHVRQYTWTVPNVVSGKVFVRITRGSQSSVSPAPFTIIGQPDFQIQYHAANSATISWPPVPGATSYVIYKLGNKYMLPVGSSTSPSYNVPIAPWENAWYSVSANNNQGATGRRAYAKKYLHTPCDVWVTLSLHFDLYPGETRWEIVNNSGNVVASGGPYTGQTPNSTLNLQQCLPSGCYELVVFDSYGDGMCCNRGNGFYQLTSASGEILANGAQFNSARVSPFCVSAASVPLSLELTGLQSVRCKSGQDGWISVQASGGTGNYSYTWNTGTAGATLSNISSGTYTVVVSDGITQTQLSVMITEPAVPFVVTPSGTPATCNSDTPTGAITTSISGGVAPYAYQWNTGATTAAITGLPPGVYSVTVTDINGCLAFASASLQQSAPPLLNLTTTHTNCSGGQAGAITSTISGGVAPYTYLWSNNATSASITDLDPGTYSLTATDANGCVAIASTSVQQGNALELELFPEAVSCHGENDGAIFTMVSGGTLPYSYIWSTGNTTGWVDDLVAGAYSLTVTDANGCFVHENTGVEQPQPLTPSAIATPATNGSNGSIFLEVSGGTAPYSYLWSNGATTQHLTGLPAGTYTVIVTDAQSCIGFASATVVPGQAPGLSYCIARGSNTNFEWIQGVQIGNYINNSGNNGGYEYFSAAAPVPLSTGATYSLSLTPGYQNTPFNESWSIWLDLNRDGDFLDAGELLFQPALTNQPISASLLIPTNAAPGLTRMRIAMKYGAPASSCGTFAYGEVEDYAVFISTGGGNLVSAPGNGIVTQQPVQQSLEVVDPARGSLTLEVADSDFNVFPNPASSFVICRYAGALEGTGKLSVFDNLGRMVNTQIVNLNGDEHTWELPLSGLANGCYRIQLAHATQTISKSLVIVGH